MNISWFREMEADFTNDVQVLIKTNTAISKSDKATMLEILHNLNLTHERHNEAIDNSHKVLTTRIERLVELCRSNGADEKQIHAILFNR